MPCACASSASSGSARSDRATQQGRLDSVAPLGLGPRGIGEPGLTPGPIFCRASGAGPRRLGNETAAVGNRLHASTGNVTPPRSCLLLSVFAASRETLGQPRPKIRNWFCRKNHKQAQKWRHHHSSPFCVFFRFLRPSLSASPRGIRSIPCARAKDLCSRREGRAVSFQVFFAYFAASRETLGQPRPKIRNRFCRKNHKQAQKRRPQDRFPFLRLLSIFAATPLRGDPLQT
jgi:hypothetical protein